MRKPVKMLLIGLIILGILVPLGIIAGGTANPGGTAFGEWSPDQLLALIGYVPAGYANLTGLYHAPLPDYGTDLASTFVGQTLGYYLAAVVGMGVLALIFYFVGRVLIVGKEDTDEEEETAIHQEDAAEGEETAIDREDTG